MELLEQDSKSPDTQADTDGGVSPWSETEEEMRYVKYPISSLLGSSQGCHTLFPRSDFHPVLYLPKPSSLQIIPLSSYRPKLYFTKDFLPLNFFLILPIFNTPGILYSGYINFH